MTTTHPTMRYPIILLLATMFILGGCRINNVKIDDGLRTYFDAEKVDGSFALYDNARNDFTIYNMKRDTTRMTPASTFKIVNAPGETIFMYEVETVFRQIYTDGRKLPNPEEVRPTWYGYSVGSWDGDTFVVDTLGFNDLGWLDAGGHGHSEDMKVQERFTRTDFGHIDVAVTITDPKVFTRPFTINFVERLLPDTDVFEHFCIEAEKDAAHMK